MTTGKPRRQTKIGLSVEALEGRRLPSTTSLFIEPQAGRAPILDAIDSAKTSIRLGICNLSDPQIGDALAAAEARGVDVKIVIDRADYEAKPPEQAEIATLIARGVPVHLSNAVFPQSFEKELVIDRREVLIMTMCLVPETFTDTRDYGLIVTAPATIREVSRVFDTDWAFSAPPGSATPAYNPTPAITDPNLIWGPIDATSKLSALIQSARRTIDVTTEVLDDPYLEGQLVAAVNRGVSVRLIAPVVPRGLPSDAASIAFLQSQGVQVRVTTAQNPAPGAAPYMHAKSMVVDGRVAYLGSIDIDTIERSQDRELGILFRLPNLVHQLAAQFQVDWNADQMFP